MIKSRSYLLSLWMIAGALVIASCAQIVNPTGGPKDTKPPHAVKYVPDSAATNFKSKEIVIFFNEYIQLRDVNTQLVISPPLRNMPDTRVKGRALYIAFNDTLRDNTTYTLSFGNSIRDITEDTPLDNFKYVFSTGPFIDSLSLSGKIAEAFSRKVEKGILVMLYDDLSDSVPYKKLPSYFTKTNADGSYRINNIHPGKYKAFALKDGNGNYLYEPKELVGFAAGPVTIGSKKDTLNMQLFQEKETKTRLSKRYVMQHGKLKFVFTGPVDDLELQPLDVQFEYQPIIEFSAQRDTVTYWYYGSDPDMITMRVVTGKTQVDTTQLILMKRGAARKQKGVEKFEFTVRSNIAATGLHDLDEPVMIEFNHPIYEYDIKKLSLLKGKDTLAYKAVFTDSVHRKLRIDYPFAADSSYRLSFIKNAFTGIYGLRNDTMNIAFKMQAQKFYGTAKVKVDLPAGSYVMQLLNDKDIVVREDRAKGSTVLDYSRLKPGNYRIRLIYDDNGNGKWDTGNYLRSIQPERTSFYPGTISIRSNWDLDLEWK